VFLHEAVDACRSKRSQPAAVVSLPADRLPFPDMSSSQTVPCFYTGQDDSWETPARTVNRDQARQMKTDKLGKFENHGRTFRLFQTLAEKAEHFWDGPFGIGNLLPFSKHQNKDKHPEKLHYPVPACGARARGTSPAHFWCLPTPEEFTIQAEA
jgi:hypothetical protein